MQFQKISNRLEFETAVAITGLLMGAQNGAVWLNLITTHGTIMSTVLGPQLANTLKHQLEQAINSMAQAPTAYPPNILFERQKLAGNGAKTGETLHAFGQNYPTKIVQAFGILMIRVNRIEQSLVEILSHMGRMPIETAHALLYSTRSNNQRLEIIRALLPSSGLPDNITTQAEKYLSKLHKLSERRNRLVHGNWSFTKDKFLVEEFTPNKKEKSTKELVTEKSIQELSNEFYTNGLGFDTLLLQIVQHRQNG